MFKTSQKFKMAVIIAVAVAVVSFVTARIILFSSPDMSFERGYSFHSWGMSRHADPWTGKWEMRSESYNKSMTEAEREVLLENAKVIRPSFSTHSQLFRQGFQRLSEQSPAALVLLVISNLGMLCLCNLGLMWLNTLAKKINAICEGDGKKTAGAVKFLLLGLITFGIYNLLWLYMLGERLQDNAQRYNLSFKESGAVVLLWFVPGIFIWVGPFIALYIIIKNTNALSVEYNKRTV
jgi:hypothetical protein